MSDSINHPEHYQPRFNSRPIECIDVTQFLEFCQGNAFKYVWRSGRKGDADKRIEDLKKACWYLRRVAHDPGLSYQSRSLRAMAVFNLIEPAVQGDLGDRLTYSALFLIVNGEMDGALAKVEALLSAIERGEA